VNCGNATASTADGPRGMYRERKDHVRPRVIVGTEIDVTNRVTKQIRMNNPKKTTQHFSI
jgi:hypothetical protein